MTTNSPVARRLRTPSWFDLRLVVGAVLVLGSVAVGALVVGRTNSLRPVLALDRDLAAGTILVDKDVHVVRVRVSDAAGVYLDAGYPVEGKVLLRRLGSGELVPSAAIGTADPAEATLTVPVKAENAPDVERGQRVEISVSTQFCQAVPVMVDVAVQDVREAGNGALSAAAQVNLVVRVSRPLAQRVVTALGLEGAVMRVGVLSGPVDPVANDALGDLTGCRAPAST